MTVQAHLHHEIRQTLRVTGVHPAMSDWPFLTELWEAVRPNAETRAFEESAARIRSEAVGAADHLGRVAVLHRAQLGESQAYQVESSLLLYHYLDAKLLLLASAAVVGCKGAAGDVQLIERGAPGRMPILELEERRGGDDEVKRVWREARKTLAVTETPAELRTLALWPRYLTASWERLKPIVKSGGFERAAKHLGEVSRGLARTLPYPLPPVTPAKPVLELEAGLPKLILCVALLSLDWQAPELLRRSPYPARARR